MNRVTVVIPNYNGIKYIGACLDAVLSQSEPCEVIVVDNGSTDGSRELVERDYPGVRLMPLSANTGFCHACNTGIHVTRTEFVLLLNDDTRMEQDCVKSLLRAIETSPRIFAVQAKMLQMTGRSGEATSEKTAGEIAEENPGERIDSAGDLYCALGWAFSRGKDRPAGRYCRRGRVFSACAGAALYRMSVLEEIGLFDERHFCYLEDVDLGFRANIAGYRSLYEPDAVVYHAGSAASGSRHNAFKEVLTAGNNSYLLYKNLPAGLYALNAPLFAIGRKIKKNYFRKKGLGEAYDQGLVRGQLLIGRAKAAAYEEALGIPVTKESIPEEAGYGVTDERTGRVIPLYLGGKVPFAFRRLPHYLRVEGMLLTGCVRRLFS